MRSVTKRGKETAFRIAWVVPATFEAETPLKSCPALWAVAIARGFAEGACDFTCASALASSCIRDTAVWQTFTIACAAAFLSSGARQEKASEEDRRLRTAL